MNRSELEKTVNNLAEKINLIVDDETRSIQSALLNLVELLVKDNDELREENQKLRDEINRLKGEQGKPNIRKQTKDNKDISSEFERKSRGKKKKKKSKKKKHKIKIDHVETCEIDKSSLPHDAIFKGYNSVVIQDIVIKTDNIKFRKKVYYSPSLNKTFVAKLSNGYQGEFGPSLKALVVDLHHNNKMTESAICSFLKTHGVMISAATISRIITDNHEDFHQEKNDIVQAGLASSIHQQMDDTGARVNGKNYYTHILCNEFYTSYFTRTNKDRLTIIDILTSGDILFQLNKSTYTLMEQMNLSEKQINRLKEAALEECMNRTEINLLLEKLFPDERKYKTSKRIILEACAITAYRNTSNAIKLLLTDDAPQFKQITDLLALCWIHDGRHYKKLNPVIPLHIEILSQFLNRYWDYYHKLLDYKNLFTENIAQSLEQEFDKIFSTVTGYNQLDERIKKTKAKKDSLLLVLLYPELPLHNNASELGARTQARYRDISLHTVTEKGTKIKDTFMTIVETSKKLSINTYNYFYDRISKKYDMPSLASLIVEMSKERYVYGSD